MIPPDTDHQANVMLSYPIDEAESLLGSKLSTAKTSFSNCEEDLDFLREQITVSGAGPNACSPADDVADDGGCDCEGV